jgi:hypothetical protein
MRKTSASLLVAADEILHVEVALLENPKLILPVQACGIIIPMIAVQHVFTRSTRFHSNALFRTIPAKNVRIR